MRVFHNLKGLRSVLFFNPKWTSSGVIFIFHHYRKHVTGDSIQTKESLFSPSWIALKTMGKHDVQLVRTENNYFIQLRTTNIIIFSCRYVRNNFFPHRDSQSAEHFSVGNNFPPKRFRSNIIDIANKYKIGIQPV